MDPIKEVFRLTLASFDIVLEQHSEGSFRVTYGEQVSHWMDYPAAATELGDCIMHALSCEGKIENVKE